MHFDLFDIYALLTYIHWTNFIKLDPFLVLFGDSTWFYRALSKRPPCTEIWTFSLSCKSIAGSPPAHRHWRAMAEWISQMLTTTRAFEKTHLSSWWNQEYQFSIRLSPIALRLRFLQPETFFKLCADTFPDFWKVNSLPTVNEITGHIPQHFQNYPVIILLKLQKITTPTLVESRWYLAEKNLRSLSMPARRISLSEWSYTNKNQQKTSLETLIN